MIEPSLLEDLVAANRILAEHGVIDAYGHVSLRAPKEHPGVRPRQQSHRRQRPDVRQRALIHSEIYRARPDVMSVVHNHSPSVVPFSVTGVKMRALFHMASFIGDGLPNFEIRRVKKGSDLLVRDPKLGAALAKTLGKSAAAR